jgi:hypothetical protein
MSEILFWVAVLLLVTIGWRVGRTVLAFLLAGPIAKQALASQPDTIRLEPCSDSEWLDVAARERTTREIEALGFADAGCFSVREMPGVRVRLLANGAESAYAALYEHAQAGSWFEFAMRFTHGSGACFSTVRATGLDPKPGSIMVHAPGTSARDLWTRARSERPARTPQPVSARSASADFERAYAESVAWRKQTGLSRMEVVRAGNRKAA